MFSETFKYKDWNDNEREETHYFHLTESKITEMNFKMEGGFYGYIKSIIETVDQKALADIFKGLIIRSYGVKSADGRRFDQSPEVVADFMQTPMYDQLYMRLARDTEYAIKFIIGILPSSMQKEIDEKKMTLEVKKAMANGSIKSLESAGNITKESNS